MEGDAARRYRDKAVEDLDRGARGGDHPAARRNIIIPYRNIAEDVQLPASADANLLQASSRSVDIPIIVRLLGRTPLVTPSITLYRHRAPPFVYTQSVLAMLSLKPQIDKK